MVGRIQSRIIGVLIVLLENLLYGHELFNGNTREAHILQLFNHIKKINSFHGYHHDFKTVLLFETSKYRCMKGRNIIKCCWDKPIELVYEINNDDTVHFQKQNIKLIHKLKYFDDDCNCFKSRSCLMRYEYHIRLSSKFNINLIGK